MIDVVGDALDVCRFEGLRRLGVYEVHSSNDGVNAWVTVTAGTTSVVSLAEFACPG